MYWSAYADAHTFQTQYKYKRIKKILIYCINPINAPGVEVHIFRREGDGGII